MPEYPLVKHDNVFSSDDPKAEYDPVEGERLAEWVHQLWAHAANGKRENTREDKWRDDWRFLSRGEQWQGAMPSYRRPIKVNVWRRGLHICLAVLTGGRPLLKLVPQGLPDPQAQIWQHALWAVMKQEHVIAKWTDAISWALVGDGGWLKVGYGARDPQGRSDVMIAARDPHDIFPDPDCTDEHLEDCSYVIDRVTLDLSAISRRYPEQGWRVTPDPGVSAAYSANQPKWAKGSLTIAPAGGWMAGPSTMRARAQILELWIDDPAEEQYERDEVVNVDPVTGTPEMRKVKDWRLKYPYGRVITCSKDTVVRDIPNPYAQAFGWPMRYPFVFVAGSEQPNALWRPGLLSDLNELQRGINKAASLVLENSIKVTNAIIIADEFAMEPEDWNELSLFPGAKIMKQRGSEIKIVFPQPLPPQAYQLPDFLIRKMEEVMGLHDPPISPGQAVAAKTVAFLQAKGQFLLGEMAKLSEEALERLGQRIIGLQRARYIPGRRIPMFGGEQLGAPATSVWPELPESLQVRVEASSGWQEVMAAAMAAAQERKPKR